MINRKELKKRAKDFAFSNKWLIWKPMLLCYLLTFGCGVVLGLVIAILGIEQDSSAYSTLESLVSYAAMPITICMYYAVMKVARGEQYDLKEMVTTKYKKFFLPIVLSSIVTGLLTALGYIFLIVPGVLLTLRFSQVNFILAETEDDSIKGLGSLKESARLMKGHYGEYFVFLLSFVGWYFAGMFSLGIAFIWVLPYLTVSQVYYYDELKKLANGNVDGGNTVVAPVQTETSVAPEVPATPETPVATESPVTSEVNNNDTNGTIM